MAFKFKKEFLSEKDIPKWWDKAILFYHIIPSIFHVLRECAKEIFQHKDEKRANNLIKQLPIPKYFIAGGVAGAAISYYIHGGKRESRIKRKEYALLFSYWASLMIWLDAYSDLKNAPRAEAMNVHILSAKLIFDQVHERLTVPPEIADKFHSWLAKHEVQSNYDTGFPCPEIIHYYSLMFSKYLVACLNHCAENKEILSRNSLAIGEGLLHLMDAQIKSFEQCDVTDGNSWEWYSENILINKFNLIFTSVLNVFPRNKCQVELVLQLLSLLDGINDLFIHRQILDDMIDFEDDCNNGIIATPGYILLDYDKDRICKNHFGAFQLKVFEEIRKSSYAKGDFTKAWLNQEGIYSKYILESKILNGYVCMVENQERLSNAMRKTLDVSSKYSEIRKCGYIYYSRALRSYETFKRKYSL